MSENQYSLLVFDWDGTLMDSVTRIVASMAAAITDLALISPGEEAIRDIIGLGLDEAIGILLPGCSGATRRKLAQGYRDHFNGDCHPPMQLFPQAREILMELHDSGYTLAIATGKSRRGLDAVLEDTGLKELFRLTRCADETRSKPHPQMLREIMESTQSAATDTIMIGDTEYDLNMARAAGAGGLAVSYGVHDRQRLLNCHPLDCLDRIGELPAWLNGKSRKSDGNTKTYAE